MRRLFPGILLLALATSLAGCNDSTNNNPTTPTTPTTPTAPATTETFTGTLHLNGAETYNFTSTTGGTVIITLTDIPDGTPAVGLSLGTWTGSACQVVIDNSNAGKLAIVTGYGDLGDQLVRARVRRTWSGRHAVRFHPHGRTSLDRLLIADC